MVAHKEVFDKIYEDARRYRFLKSRKYLNFSTHKPENWLLSTGEKVVSRHLLVTDDIQYTPKGDIDDTIDYAIDREGWKDY